ncbi:MAG: hydrogenase maturation nickel metallochaperone HypA [Vicinamibacterales bacterium]
MHEYSIVSALYDRIAAEAGQRGATAVTAVRVRIGELSGVEVGLLRTAYDTFREGTLCAGAPLDVEAVPALWACRACGASPERGARLVCPDCGEPVRLVQGDEIVLERIELEVP